MDRNYNCTLTEQVAEGLIRGGDKSFAIWVRADGSKREYSFAEILREGELLREKIRSAGLKKGDRVAIISTLRPFWYSIYYASLRDGYIMTCIDPGIPEKQVCEMLSDCQVRAVFSGCGMKKLPEELEGKIPLYTIDEGFALLKGPEKLDASLPAAEKMDEEGCFILFSSGTTGEKRKGVLHSRGMLPLALEFGTSTKARVYKDTVPFPPCERDLMLFPPYHIAGMLCAYYDLISNAEIIMLERLSPKLLASAMQELKPDMICTVPSMLSMLMKKVMAQLGGNPLLKGAVKAMLALCGFVREHTGLKIGRKLLGFLNKRIFGGRLTRFRLGGSPCEEETMRFFLAMGLDVNLTYGLTELGAPLVCTGEGYYPGGTGRVLRHNESMDFRIVNVDEKGRGEVEVLSPLRMISYTDPGQMKGCFTEDGYFKTGDLGYFDERNCLVISGRAKESMVLRNGEKLLPEEIEAMYANILDVDTLAVFRVPDGSCDAFSIAAVKNKAKGVPDEVVRLTIADRAANLPAIYTPREIYMLPELPLSSTKKVQRFRLTEMVLEGRAAPVSDASMRQVNDEGTAGKLRALLAQVGGSQWNSVELTEGMLLNLDSLQLMDLYVAIEDSFGIDLFTLAKQPDTFGELLDAVENFELVDKNDKPELDLSAFPQQTNELERGICVSLEQLARLIYGVKRSGIENIPKEGSFIICSNHVTALDPGWICGSMRRRERRNTAVVGKSDVLYDKKFRLLVRGQNLVPVDRTGNSRATLERCEELLAEGWNVLIFPEGTNFENAKNLMPLKEGPARLAIKSGCPIVPVHIKGVAARNADEQSFLPKPGRDTQVVFGKPIDPAGHDVQSLNEAMRLAIESL